MISRNTANLYAGIANAIILQAVKDYRDVNKKLLRGKINEEARITKTEVLDFFRSEWFCVLTELDPEVLIQRLDEEVLQ